MTICDICKHDAEEHGLGSCLHEDENGYFDCSCKCTRPEVYAAELASLTENAEAQVMETCHLLAEARDRAERAEALLRKSE
jgi:hypothetical protein